MNDYTIESNLYPSTNASSVTSPVFADKELFLNKQESSVDNQKKSLCELNLKSLALDYDNLNDCVAALLKKSKDECGNGRDIKRRQRKNKDQVKILEQEYKKNNNWTREYIKKVSQKLGLRECQVYKWHWDQRKKDGLENILPAPLSQNTSR